MEQAAARTPHYGIRKLSVGVASVLISSSTQTNATADNTAKPQAKEQPKFATTELPQTGEKQRLNRWCNPSWTRILVRTR